MERSTFRAAPLCRADGCARGNAGHWQGTPGRFQGVGRPRRTPATHLVRPCRVFFVDLASSVRTRCRLVDQTSEHVSIPIGSFRGIRHPAGKAVRTQGRNGRPDMGERFHPHSPIWSGTPSCLDNPVSILVLVEPIPRLLFPTLLTGMCWTEPGHSSATPLVERIVQDEFQCHHGEVGIN